MSNGAVNTAVIGDSDNKGAKTGKQPASKAAVKEKTTFYSLRFRSTGLGTTMMEGESDGFDVIDDMLVMYIQTTTPTRWKIRSALTYKALVRVVWQAFRWKVIKFVLFGWWHYKNPKLTKEF